MADRPNRRGTPVLYVVDNLVVNEFNATTGKQIGKIGGFGSNTEIDGIATDVRGNLYVANYDFNVLQATIYVFAPGKKKPFRTLPDGDNFANISVSTKGEVGAANRGGDGGGGGPGNVSFFKPDQSEPDRVIREQHFYSPLYAAFESGGTLWINAFSVKGDFVFGYVASGSKSITPVSLDPAPRDNRAISVDPSGNLLAIVSSNMNAYNSKGKVVYSTALGDLPSHIIDFTLSSDGSLLYVSDQAGTVVVYDFPAGGMPVATFQVGGLPESIALGTI